MTTFNTGNPIGSTDARDRSDNSENLDLAVNSLSQTFVDRLGVTRDTLEGIYQKSAYYRAGTFEAGYTLTNNRQTLAYENVEYSWSGAFPKVVAAGSTPATSGGIGAGAWVDRTDLTLRGVLASHEGASLIGAIGGSGVETTVQEELDVVNSNINVVSSDVDVLLGKDTGSVSDVDAFLTVGNYSRLKKVDLHQNYINGTSVPKGVSLPYDHFGNTFKNRRGEILSIFRRGPTHVNSRGVIMISSFNSDGQWGQAEEITVMSDPVLDARVAAGGMMPNGTIVVSVNYMNPTTSKFGDVKFFQSKDDGDTWNLIQTIDVNQSNGYSYNIPFGKASVVGNYVVIPRYKCIGSTFYTGYYRSSDGGDTWSEFDVYTGTSNFNESAVVCIGRLGFMVSRIGSGVSGQFQLFRSVDGGATWSNLGASSLTGGDTAYTVAPSMDILRNDSGSPYIVLQYLSRTDHVLYYRTSLVSSILSGDYSFSEKQQISGSLDNNSGYQSGFFEGRRFLGVVYRETPSQNAASGVSFEFSVQNPPDYDSGWFPVAALSAYTKSFGFSQKPSNVKVFFSPDATGDVLYEVEALNNTASGVIYGIGAIVRILASSVFIRTGAKVFSTTLFGEEGTGFEYSSGYYRVKVWL